MKAEVKTFEAIAVEEGDGGFVPADRKKVGAIQLQIVNGVGDAVAKCQPVMCEERFADNVELRIRASAKAEAARLLNAMFADMSDESLPTLKEALSRQVQVAGMAELMIGELLRDLP